MLLGFEIEDSFDSPNGNWQPQLHNRWMWLIDGSNWKEREEGRQSLGEGAIQLLYN